MYAYLKLFPSLAPFSGPANAVIVTPTPLKADTAPNTGLVIAPRLGGVCFHSPFEQMTPVLVFTKSSFLILVTQVPGFRVVSRAQKSPQPIVPKESRKSQKASSSAGERWPAPQRAIGSPNEPSFNIRTFFYAVQGKPGSDEGSPCGLDPPPSPGSLISSSSTPLVKNEQKQVGALPCMHVWAGSERTGFNETSSRSMFHCCCVTEPQINTHIG